MEHSQALHLIRIGSSDTEEAKGRQDFITMMSSSMTPIKLRRLQGLSVTLERDIPLVRTRQVACSILNVRVSLWTVMGIITLWRNSVPRQFD